MLQVSGVSFVDVVRGGSVIEIPDEGNFGIRVRIELMKNGEDSSELAEEILRQLRNGEVKVVGMLYSHRGDMVAADAALVFKQPERKEDR